MKVLKWSLGIAVVSASVFSYGANLLTSGKIKVDVISGSLQYLGGITGIARLSENIPTKKESAVVGNSRTNVADQRGSFNDGNSSKYVSVTALRLTSPDSVYQPDAVTWDRFSAELIPGYKSEFSPGIVAAVYKTDWLEFSPGISANDGGNRSLPFRAIAPPEVINVSPVPEPDTYLMMLAGLVMMSCTRRRCQRR